MAAAVPGHRAAYECPICFEQLIPSVFQCFNGHLLCKVCILKVEKCPICRDEMPKERNIRALEVENIIKSLDLQCPFVKNGCPLLLKHSQMESHKLDCLYASMDYCRRIGISGINGCAAGGNLAVWNLVGHLKAVHLLTDYRLILLKMGRKYTRQCHILPAGCCQWKDIFIFYDYNSTKKLSYVKFFVKVNWDAGRVSWTPYLMGSERPCEAYLCRIKLESQHVKTSLEWEGPVFSPESKVEKTKIALNLSEECIRGFDPSESAVKTGGDYKIVMSFCLK